MQCLRRAAAGAGAGGWCLIASFLLLLVVSHAPVATAQPDLGTCFADGSNPVTPSNVTNTCQCVDGWVGPECAVCTKASACQALQNYTGPLPAGRLTCDMSMEIIERAHGVCRVATQGVNDFLRGQAYVTAQLSAAGEMHFEFIKVSRFWKRGGSMSLDPPVSRCSGGGKTRSLTAALHHATRPPHR